MLWPSTTPVAVKLVLVIAVIVCRFFRPPHPPNRAENLIHVTVFLAAFWTFWGSLLEYLFVYSVNFTRVVQRFELVPQYGNMFLVVAASFWLIYRSLQTLRLPVHDLIDILKVDVPDAPDVSLAGIRSDSATLEWSRPSNTRPVQKYVIQVNGVNVGSPGAQDTAIIVTGLKPGHFYNIRVIAVGSNNFQSGSPVIRLRTYGKDSRPQLANGRLPPSFVDQEQTRRKEAGQDDDTEPPRSPRPAIESAPPIDGSTSRDTGSGAASHRRNTVGRRHSPSVASTDQPLLKDKSATDKGTTGNESQESLAELNEKFQRIRKEIADTVALYDRDEADFKQQEEQLRKDLESKRQTLKEKESNTEQLRKRINITGEQMRAAEKERAKKEQLLKDKKAKLASTEDRISKLQAEMESMKTQRERFAEKKAELDEFREKGVADLDAENGVLQEECSKLEAELKEKGKMLKELKQERQKLPGGEADDRWKDTDLQLKKEWEGRRKTMDRRIMAEMQRRHELTTSVRVLHGFIEEYRAQQASLGNPYLQSSVSGVELGDPGQQPTQSHIKRPSRHSGSITSLGLPAQGQLPQPESFYAIPSAFGSRASFAPGPYVDVATTADSFSHDQELTQADIRSLTAGAPLSPTATSLIPAGILGDDEPLPSPVTRALQSPFGRPASSAARADVDPQSPASSSRSLSLISSPHGSSHHLPYSFSGEPGDRRSRELGIGSPPAPSAAQSSRFTSLFSPFQRARTASKAVEAMGPPLGTLKPGQSRSFPRQADEWDVMGNKRKISLAGSLFNRNSVHSVHTDNGEGLSAGSSGLSGRRLNPFGGSHGTNVITGISREPSSPRPASIASSDRIRPSTESGSIWGLPSDSTWTKSRLLWSSDGQRISRNPSRRPSLHGQSIAPETSLASAEDEILDDEELLNPQVSPSQVGVIGSRPPTSRSMAQRLNPTAPTFMTTIFGGGKAEGKTKGKDKSRQSADLTLHIDDSSPSGSRKSRDTFSLHTQTSVSESHESLHLDGTLSNTPSELSGFKEPQDNVVKKLFRKGSSSRFNLSSRLGKDSGLFKKGPSSTTNSDKNLSSADRTSSVGDMDDVGDLDAVMLGRSYESTGSGPSLGQAKSRDGGAKEVRKSSWFGMKKKDKDKDKDKGAKESLDMERTRTLASDAGSVVDEERG
ncbi:uncharacterized protein DNG_04922 [Cephalotrichum gorgonifer]|uniref:Fibronectin type-III domain-containing protein n=1 Tax=Cephalotrichum gorgonifer TaxID=2041049 RepID=A0AAE8SVB7_9PEZI|nr:uncharacterized protein DNG_04922 [Cephalotrichum gorgonifer]